MVPPGGQSRRPPGCTPRRRPASGSGSSTESAPRAAGEVMVSSGDVAENGWTVGHRGGRQRAGRPLFDGKSVPEGTVTIVGVYTPDPDDDWLGAPLTGRVGQQVQDVGVATDDWVTVEDTLLGATVATWYRVTSSVAWPLDTVDHDDLVEVGPIVSAYQADTAEQGRHHLDPRRDRPAEPVPAGRRRERPGADHGRGPGGAAAGPGRGGALDGARRGHRRPALRGGAGAAARPRSPRGRGVPARRAAAAHPDRGGDRRARRSAGDEPGRPGGLPGAGAARAARRVPARGAGLRGRGPRSWCSRRRGEPCASRSTRSCARSRPGTPAPAPGRPRSR